jgi:hypothetical protein
MLPIDTSVWIGVFRDRSGQVRQQLEALIAGRDVLLTRFTQLGSHLKVICGVSQLTLRWCGRSIGCSALRKFPMPHAPCPMLNYPNFPCSLSVRLNRDWATVSLG